MQIGDLFFTGLDRAIRNIASFGVTLLTTAYLFIHPQLADRRLTVGVTAIVIIAWTCFHFLYVLHPSRRGSWLGRISPYMFIVFAGWINWLFAADVPSLAVLFPIVAMFSGYGRSRSQAWGLTLAATATAVLTPWLANHLHSPAARLHTGFIAGCTGLLAGCFTELHHHHSHRFVQQAQRLQRAETMATVGLMATAAAHEIRNPLTSIKGFVQYMRGHDLVDRRAAGYLSLLDEDADRIARTVDRFVRLGRPLAPAPVSLDAADAVRELTNELSAQALLVGVDIVVHAEPVPPVWADRVLLQKAVRHTLQNGLEAMAGRSGRLTVHIGPGPAGYVDIRIQDGGPGMDRQQLMRAFDVFYTTKAGAGLGLPLVRRIMDAHGGDVRLTSRRRQGTTASLLWPTVAAAPAAPAAAAGAGYRSSIGT